MNLDDHVTQITEVMMQSLYKTCDWQLDRLDVGGFDDFNAIHSELMRRVIAEMVKEIQLDEANSYSHGRVRDRYELREWQNAVSRAAK